VDKYVAVLGPVATALFGPVWTGLFVSKMDGLTTIGLWTAVAVQSSLRSFCSP
jgi:hypothetical protein